jgi:chromosome segregation ATPase
MTQLRQSYESRIRTLEERHTNDQTSLRQVGEQLQQANSAKNESLKKLNEIDQKVKKYKRKRKRDQDELETLKAQLAGRPSTAAAAVPPSTTQPKASASSSSSETDRLLKKQKEELEKDKALLTEQVSVLKDEIHNLQDANKLQEESHKLDLQEANQKYDTLKEQHAKVKTNRRCNCACCLTVFFFLFFFFCSCNVTRPACDNNWNRTWNMNVGSALVQSHNNNSYSINYDKICNSTKQR